MGSNLVLELTLFIKYVLINYILIIAIFKFVNTSGVKFLYNFLFIGGILDV